MLGTTYMVDTNVGESRSPQEPLEISLLNDRFLSLSFFKIFLNPLVKAKLESSSQHSSPPSPSSLAQLSSSPPSPLNVVF